jgi:hypothetical protein
LGVEDFAVSPSESSTFMVTRVLIVLVSKADIGVSSSPPELKSAVLIAH